ncbi:hypothetical protein C4564_03975 [Candidatus Microgenomates bacterium]|nr:MAG: hypothetical protein C4564_03975 [Candidatus Microgenomates bacterium]
MPARRRTVKSSTKKTFKLIRLVPVLLLLMFLWFVSRPTEDRQIVVAPNGDSVQVGVFDFSQDRIVSLQIPGSTEVVVAGQYGTWRIGSVWKLAKSEGLSGRMLADTTLKSLHIPVDTWSNESLSGVLEGGVGGSVAFLVNGIGTGLTFGERIKILAFSVQTAKGNRNVVNLDETSFLTSKMLADGENGYVVTGSVPLSIASLLASPDTDSKVLRVGIKNSTGLSYTQGSVRELISVVETLGGKVLSVEDLSAENVDCVVMARETDSFSKHLSKLIQCDFKKSDTGNFEIIIEVGEQFVKRF